jgi:predicted DNA-binding protein YlxM (UPF0122 family)
MATKQRTLSIEQKKEWAKLLYTQYDYSQKEIAEKVDVSTKTMVNWVRDGKWEEFRISLLTTKQDQLRRLYLILDRATKKIEEDADGGDSGDGDKLLKYTQAIKNLENDTSIAAIVEAGSKFVEFVKSNDLEKAKEITKLFDAFVESELS